MQASPLLAAASLMRRRPATILLATSPSQAWSASATSQATSAMRLTP